MKLRYLTASIMAASLAQPVLADKESAFEIFVGASNTQWDKERNLDDNNAIEVGAELPLTQSLSVELWGNDYETDVKNSNVEVDGNRYALGALYHFADGDIRPFIAGGGAHQDFETSATEAQETLAYLGLGLKAYLFENLILRGEVLAMNSLDEEQTDAAARLSVGYAFGRKSSQVDESAYEEDSAYEDEAVQEEPMEEKDNSAEEAAAAAAAAAAAVAASKDSDNDGVPDVEDQCPDTDPAFKVDEKGCPETLVESVELSVNVQFANNSSAFADEAGEVQKLADFLKKYTGASVVVEGHSDSVGAAKYNKWISQKRAEAVKDSLVKDHGIEASRIEAIGYGEEQPIASNETAEGRAENRRVVAKVSAEVEKQALK